eukprot:scaffold9295_cov122-Isochrysis_galbana.AAC.10
MGGPAPAPSAHPPGATGPPSTVAFPVSHLLHAPLVPRSIASAHVVVALTPPSAWARRPPRPLAWASPPATREGRARPRGPRRFG